MKTLEWIRSEWYWRVGRRFNVEHIQWWIANHLPRRIAMYAFVRVYANGIDSPGPEYVSVCKKWEANGKLTNAGRRT